MATFNLTAEKFEETVTADGITFIDFWAEWCGPCKSFGPVYEKASDANADIRFAKVDTEAEQDLAGVLRIQSIPTIMAFRDGVLLFSQPGALQQLRLTNSLPPFAQSIWMTCDARSQRQKQRSKVAT